MKNYRKLAVGAAIMFGVAFAPTAYAQQEKPLSTQQLNSFMQEYGGSDGTLTLQQATKAAQQHFGALDTDNDGTVDEKELVPAGVSTGDFTAVDPDKDKKIQKEEYLNLVKQKFNSADANHNKKLTKEELNSQSGQALMRLLK